ncbi:MAG: hypothetical protein RLW61_05530 [Gammaproteobacteria bacterium]
MMRLVHHPPPADTAAAAAKPAPSRTSAATAAFGDDGLTFGDLVDLVNPLHHLPVIGNLYRKLTGDTIAPALRIGGGALFGGPFGAALAAAGVVAGSLLGRDGGAPPLPAEVPGGVAPGGWMVAAARPLEQLPAHAAASAARVATASDARGTPAAGDGIAPAPATPPRRGGWMVAAAYAMTDATRAGESRDERLDTHA